VGNPVLFIVVPQNDLARKRLVYTNTGAVRYIIMAVLGEEEALCRCSYSFLHRMTPFNSNALSNISDQSNI
jgi:hypothetical protein